MNKARAMGGLLFGLGLAGALAHCSGPDGPAGNAGATGATGAQGVAGPAGPAGDAASGTGLVGVSDAGIPVSCLSPCHGFNGVVSQYQTSSHYITYLQNVGSSTAEEWVAPGGACGNCHAIDALNQRATGSVGTVGDAGVPNLAHGELQYRNATSGALSSATYVGSANTAQVYCTTCHAVTNANDPHKTGIPWTPGSFPLQVSDAGAVFVEKSPTTSAVVGTNAGSYGAGNTCMWCHRSRVDITNYLTPTNNKLTSVYWGPHEGPQTDVFTGTGGYHFGGQVYGTSTHQQKLSCIDCHMPQVTMNAGVPDHSFNANIAACKTCHATATTYDINGFQSQVQAAMTEIETWLNGQGLLTRSPSPPYTPLDAMQLGDGNWDQDTPLPGGTIGGTTLTQDQAGALYNYLLVARGSAYGTHNPKYTAELLYDSYFALSGLPLATFPARP